MSVKLLKLFFNTLKPNLLRVSPKPGLFSLQYKLSTAMDVIQIDNKIDNKEDEIIPNKKQTRFKKRYLKRQWEELSINKIENGETAEKKQCDKPVERIKRKKMAMLLGYCGVEYFGMQRNPGVMTIEEVLLKALWDAKYITEVDFTNQQNAQFQRSSRTDKGVSAARQVVSLKLPLEVNAEEINRRLPPSIRVFGIKRVTNKFNSKAKCNARTYSYTVPTYVFEPSCVTDEDRKQYRLPSEKLEKINEVLSHYKGTKSYHNFTEKKYYNDPSANRYMMNFSVEKVFVESDMEFAVLLVKGQSFMLHQIRKMVGLTIAVLRGHADMSIMEKAFAEEKVIIPTAPGLGLVLDMVHYDRYDTRYKDSHESLTWDSEEEAVQKFRHDFIFPVIVKGEVEENSMGDWLEKLSVHSYEPTEHVTEKEECEKETGDDDDDDAPNGDDHHGDKDNTNEVTDDKTDVSEVVQSNNRVCNESQDIDEKNNGAKESDLVESKGHL